MPPPSRATRLVIPLAGLALLGSVAAISGDNPIPSETQPRTPPAAAHEALRPARQPAVQQAPNPLDWLEAATTPERDRAGSAWGLRSFSIASSRLATPIVWRGSLSDLLVAARTDPARTGRDAESPDSTSSESPADTVLARRPSLHVDAGAADAQRVSDAIRDVPGVAAAAAVVRSTVSVNGAQGPTAVTVATVDPDTFRPLTPQVTAEAEAVWDRLRDGDGVFTHDAAARLGVVLGDDVRAAGSGRLRIGALAANGVPPVAEVLVNADTADRLGLVGEGSVLVAPVEAVPAQALADAIAEATGLVPSVQTAPEAHRAFLTGDDTRKAFEPFTYLDNGDGLISIDPAWVERNIVTARVPVLRGPVQCHRLLIEQLRGALAELEARGLDSLIDPEQYGGCHVARHIDFDPSLPLSMHAWGLAVDLNVDTNPLGGNPTMDARVVEVFERWGFAWGGRWTRPDGMHFELAALLEPDKGQPQG